MVNLPTGVFLEWIPVINKNGTVFTSVKNWVVLL